MAPKMKFCDLVLIWKYLDALSMCCRLSNTIFLFLDCAYKYEKNIEWIPLQMKHGEDWWHFNIVGGKNVKVCIIIYFDDCAIITPSPFHYK